MIFPCLASCIDFFLRNVRVSFLDPHPMPTHLDVPPPAQLSQQSSGTSLRRDARLSQVVWFGHVSFFIV